LKVDAKQFQTVCSLAGGSEAALARRLGLSKAAVNKAKRVEGGSPAFLLRCWREFSDHFTAEEFWNPYTTKQ
jgi:hypothetical protein